MHNRGDCHGKSHLWCSKCLLQWWADPQKRTVGPLPPTPTAAQGEKKLMSHEAAELSLSSRQIAALQCPARAPSWVKIRTHQFLPALPLPGTQGTMRTGRPTACPAQKKTFWFTYHLMKRVSHLGRAYFPTLQCFLGLLGKARMVWRKNLCIPTPEKNIPAAAPPRKSPLQICPPASYQWGPLPLCMCQYLLTSPSSITWCETSHHGSHQAVCVYPFRKGVAGEDPLTIICIAVSGTSCPAPGRDGSQPAG